MVYILVAWFPSIYAFEMVRMVGMRRVQEIRTMKIGSVQTATKHMEFSFEIDAPFIRSV